MRFLLIVLTFLFTLFYRPLGSKGSWSEFGTYDTPRQARESAEELGEKIGPIEIRVAPILAIPE